MSETPQRLQLKVAEELRKSQECLASLQSDLRSTGKLFEDPEFPPGWSVLPAGLNQALPRGGQIQWKRPQEICRSPMFSTGGTSRFDVRQGVLGDCWLLAAVASLSMHQELFDQIVQPGQEFSSPDYCGMFRFNFWQFGQWTEVIIDDRLPTCNGRLIFMHSTDSSEFWSALLEKAYAKVMGSYHALIGGSTTEAMEDFTGGITEFYSLGELQPQLFDIMQVARKRCSLIGCSITADPNQIEARMPNGLIMGHAYSVTAVELVKMSNGDHEQLVRIRNPWGNEEEWRGSWSDNSRDWRQLEDSERQRIGQSADADGEFWMSFGDFVANFDAVEICNLGPESAGGRWEAIIHHGCWKKNVSAGGCRKYLQTFAQNPQYRVRVVDPDEDDDEDLGSLVIGLMQKNMRKLGSPSHYIGYMVYALDGSDVEGGPRSKEFFKYTSSSARSPSFTNSREITGRHRLAPGDYVIVPSTFEPNMEAEFVLRIYSEKPNESEMIDEIIDIRDDEVTDEVGNEFSEQERNLNARAAAAFEQYLSSDASGLIADELMDLLNTAFARTGPPKFTGFTREACRSLLAFVDIDQSGALQFDELKILWKNLRLWSAVFKAYDADESGNFSSFELRGALRKIGFHVPNQIYQLLILRYSSREGGISFEDFVVICVRLKSIVENFKAQAGQSMTKARFDLDEYLQMALYT